MVSKYRGKLFAGRPVRDLVAMSHDLARIEHVHVDVHVDLVVSWLRRSICLAMAGEFLPQIVNADVLDERSSSIRCRADR